MSMRQLVFVLGGLASLAGLGSGAAGCGGDDDGPGATEGSPEDAGDAGGATRDADADGGAEAGPVDAAVAVGLGESLSWYCPVGRASCPPSEVTTYNRCLLDRCEPALMACPCEAWISCTTRCGCGDVACRAACIPTFDCLVCGQSVARCVNESGCERPACYEPPPTDAGVREGGVVVVVPPAPVLGPDARPADGAVSPADAAPVTDGGLQGTCADLRRCCDSLAADARATCLMQAVVLGSDPLCAAALLVYRGNGTCQ
jgi:hypothetical protein